MRGPGGEQPESERLKSGAGGGGVPRLPRPDILNPFRLDALQAHRQSADERVGHGERRVAGFQLGPVFFQIE
jgi:hypothetical protein